jgi:phosphoglycolate phosphatase
MNVLLDLDGTLTDPREGIVNCVRHAYAGLGHPCPSDRELERYIGPPLQTSFGAVFGRGSAKIQQAIDLYRHRFSTTGLFENKVYAGIPAALKTLRQLGATLFVATSKPTVFAERIVDHFGLGSEIQRVFGSELDGTRSDKAELIAHVLKTQAISPLETYMVGDREHDIQGAKANEVFAIGALWGYGSREELLNAGAAALCERPGMLAKVLSSNSALDRTRA